MCDLLCRRYTGRGGCGHTIAYDYQRCNIALQRPDRRPCLPPSGRMRDLDRVVDTEDDHMSGVCPVCKGETPPSSEGSEFMLML